MLGKKMFYKRSVMIAIAVMALMTLTAGVAAAKANKANFSTSGDVLGVALSTNPLNPPSVTTEFKLDKKTSDIKSVKIHTVNEQVFGMLSAAAPDCKESDKKSGTACDSVTAILAGAFIESTHESTATLKVTKQPEYYEVVPFTGAYIHVITGTLKGKLAADLDATGSQGLLEGTAKLKIRGTDQVRYACVVGGTPLEPVFGLIDHCQFGPGLLVPIELHVKDTGNFKIEGADSSVRGKLTVTVDSGFALVDGEVQFVTTGGIEISKAMAEFGN
ncbi:MAG: hypothetical protein HOJ22_02930 [Chloroflexi bacterium]|jgi:hypothetical protein|nr:hypothetical protein [Chloroflexota bacterium]MBT5627222.1 hypothetical protein [Chloroflexota bacterium]